MIIKGYSGFYYVWDGNVTWECSLRGKFRIKKQKFLPGDTVTVTVIDESKKKAVIENVKPRKVEMVRPSIANIEQVIIVMAFNKPEPDLWLLDRLLIMAQNSKVQPVICFNKADLLSAAERKKLIAPYEKLGLLVLQTSSKRGWSIKDLKECLRDNVSVLAGPSGVGKSSLLNAVEKGLSLKTGEISEKMLRGKHTTRHVELIPLSSGGLIADTPGFSQVYLPKDLKREELINYYPDFWEYSSKCRFTSCLHRDEPHCGVRESVVRGLLDEGRYQRYLYYLDEVIAEERRY